MDQVATRVNRDSSNGLGIAGFVISLVGLCSGGVLSPIGLIVSIIAVGREPKGFAIAGIVIGALGSCGILLTLFFLPLLIIGILVAAGASAIALAIASAVGGPTLEAFVEMQIINEFVEERLDETGSLPTSLDDVLGTHKLAGELTTDPWGNPYIFEVTPDGVNYRLYSSGPDGVPGTADDVDKDHFSNGRMSSPPPPAAPTPALDADPEPVETPEPVEPADTNDQ